jgi:hypothetical protein
LYSRVGFLYHQEREKEKERERESPKALCSVPVCSLRFFPSFFFLLFFPSFVGCFWKKTEESASDIFLSSSSSSKVFFSLTKESARCSLLPKKIFRSERGSRKTRRRGLFERHRRGSFASFASSSSSFFFPRRCFEGFLEGLPRVVHTIFGRSRSNFWREVIV